MLNKKGFTLIELLTALFIGLMVIGILVSSYMILFKVWVEQTEKSKINNQFVDIATRISQQIVSNNLTEHVDYEILALSDLLTVENLAYNASGNVVVIKVSAKVTGNYLTKPYYYEQYFNIRQD